MNHLRQLQRRAPRRKSRPYLVLKRMLRFALITATVLLVVTGAALVYLYYDLSRDLPDAAAIARFELAFSSRVHAADGSLIGEYARERRLYIPLQMVPKHVANSFLAVEDPNFYQHGGLDYVRMMRSVYSYISGFRSNRRPVSASTITQQVARNFFLSPERSFTRKIREALLARQIEATLSKDEILELYLNQIYLGVGSYGIAAASQAYFGRPVSALTIAETAYLVTSPGIGLQVSHPVHDRSRTLQRRNYIIDRMRENGFITEADANTAREEPLPPISRHDPKSFAGEYFAEDVRRDLIERYGEALLYEGGLSVQTSLDPKIQIIARDAMRRAAVNLDERGLYRGAITKIDISGDWGVKLSEIAPLSDIAPWRLAVVLESGDQSARIGLQPVREFGSISKQRDTGLITLDGVKWARPVRGRTPTTISQILKAGDVIYAEPIYKDGHPAEGQYQLRQVPAVSAAMVAMDVSTGAVLAMAGGFSFDQTPFNRATRSCRPPGSSFRPIVYSAAIANGSTVSKVASEAPIEIRSKDPARWRINSLSATSVETGLPAPALRNQWLMSPDSMKLHKFNLQLVQDSIINLPGDAARRLSVTGNLAATLSTALRSDAATAMTMVTAASMVANGGQRITPALIDRIDDIHGHTIFTPQPLQCRYCAAMTASKAVSEPPLLDPIAQEVNLMTAWRIKRLADAVVEGGTATMLRVRGPATTDAWFIGLLPDIAIVIQINELTPRGSGMGTMAACGPTAPIKDPN